MNPRQWTCEACNYMNAGPICTHCGAKPPPCPRCEGTGRYRSFPWERDRACAVCNGSGICPEEQPENSN